MAKKTCRITKEDYSGAIDWLHQTLADMEVTQEEILTAELLTEENFLRLAAASGDDEAFFADLTIRKRLGDVILAITAKGEGFNPIVTLDEVPDEEEMVTLALLKAHRNEMSYSRRNGNNVVSIRVHTSTNKSAIYTVFGLGAGVVLGLALKASLPADTLLWIGKNIFTPVESIFMHALMMLVAPMIFFSVMSGITGMSDAAEIGRMGGKLMALSVVKLAVILAMGAALGLWMGAAPELAAMMGAEESAAARPLSVIDVVVNIVPGSLIGPFAETNLLQVLFLACFFGILLVRAGERAAGVRDSVSFFNRFIMDAMGTILPVMPLVVAVSMAKLMMNTETSVLLAYGRIIAAVCIEYILVFLVCAVFMVVVGRVSPVPFLKKVFSFCVLPFSLRSSNACMPETLELCGKKLGIDEKLSMFSIPVGMQFNMMGAGAYIIMLALMMRLTFGFPVDLEFLLSFSFAVLLVTFTFPSVPGATIVVMASVFGMAGVPAGAVTLFIGIDPLLEGLRTAANVAGNIASTFLLARLENKVDEGVYNED